MGNLLRGSGIRIFLLNTCAESKMAAMTMESSSAKKLTLSLVG